MMAFFGAHNLSNNLEPGRYTLFPKNIIIHELWNYGTIQYDSDLALLEFEKGSIHFSHYVQPVCFRNTHSVQTGMEGIVPGWGQSENTERKHEDIPKHVRVLVQKNEECLPGENDLARLSSTKTFCAGLVNGSGVCVGDSGGGLYIIIDGVYHLKGIVSSALLNDFGCNVFKNAIYTNIVKFRQWIETTAMEGRKTLEPNVVLFETFSKYQDI